jgi:hypothetical protein
LVEYYRKHGVLRDVNGMSEPRQVTEEVLGVLAQKARGNNAQQPREGAAQQR